MTTLTKSTDHGNDINPGIDPESTGAWRFIKKIDVYVVQKGSRPIYSCAESETQNESQMSESNNKTTETESERSEHRKYRKVSEKLWPWFYLKVKWK